jgi:4-hydroxybenzoate polyprenyltransferase
MECVMNRLSPAETLRGRSVGVPGAAIKIVLDVLIFRLRKLEMANLAAATSIAIALGLPIASVAWRTLFALVLNVLVYLNNDYIDVAVDLQAGNKDAHKSRFLHQNMRAALVAQLSLLVLLATAAFLVDHGLLVPLIAGGGVCLWYSAQLKRQPIADVMAMIAWGVTMPLCGVPLWAMLGLGGALALQLGLFSGVFECIQVMRDADEDALEGVRTTGVVLGQRRTLMLTRALMVASTVYALLVMHPLAAAVTAVALMVPFLPNNLETYWTRVKLTYGVAWLVLCVTSYLNGGSTGLLWSIKL